MEADVKLVEALGSELQVHFSIDAHRVVPEESAADLAPEESELNQGGAGVARVGPHVPAKPGERIRFAIDEDAMHFFEPETGVAIWK